MQHPLRTRLFPLRRVPGCPLRAAVELAGRIQTRRGFPAVTMSDSPGAHPSVYHARGSWTSGGGEGFDDFGSRKSGAAGSGAPAGWDVSECFRNWSWTSRRLNGIPVNTIVVSG